MVTLAPADGRAVIVLVNANGGIGFAHNGALLNGITAVSLSRDYRGEGAAVWPKATFLMMVLLPLLFLVSTAWAWRKRAELGRKRAQGPAGLFSLWFPVATTLAMAVFLLAVVPRFFGGSLHTLMLFQPDFAVCMVAAALTGPVWAIFRLVLAYRTVPAIG